VDALVACVRLLTGETPVVETENRPGFTVLHYARMEKTHHCARSRDSQYLALAQLVALLASDVRPPVATHSDIREESQ
jgi:hypothetical protein